MAPSYAAARRTKRGVTITLHLTGDELPQHHPSNFERAAIGLAMLGVALCLDTEQARTVLEGLARENRQRRRSAGQVTTFKDAVDLAVEQPGG